MEALEVRYKYTNDSIFMNSYYTHTHTHTHLFYCHFIIDIHTDINNIVLSL